MTLQPNYEAALSFSTGLGPTGPGPVAMEAHRGPCIEDNSLTVGPSPLPCQFGGVYLQEPSLGSWMLFGDLVSRLSNGPYGASCG